LRRPSQGDGEDALLAGLRRRLARRGHDRLGDDAALLPGGGASWAVTVDQQIEGVHFPPDTPAARWARRLVAVCLSDVAAMGGRPLYAFLALQAAAGLDVRVALEAVADACAAHGTELAGGDIAADRRSGATLTVLARLVAGGRWLRRSAARPEDSLWLGGPVGWSRLGRDLQEPGTLEALPEALRRRGRDALRIHRRPAPQLALGQALSRRPRCAAIDVSDGLALDLHRLCLESGVGATIVRDHLPVPPAELAGALGHDALDCALHGGEDYVLLFALPSDRPPPRGHRAVHIGTVTRRRGLRLVGRDGRATPLPPGGWDHLQTPGRGAD
jgi:thiamine-monophosphate kinase